MILKSMQQNKKEIKTKYQSEKMETFLVYHETNKGRNEMQRSDTVHAQLQQTLDNQDVKEAAGTN